MSSPCDTATGAGALDRIASIDALRGLVMLLMLVDHTRGFFLQHMPVRNPIDLAVTPPDLALTRVVSHLCAPVFILLTGLSAALYRQKQGSRSAASRFLLLRGLLLLVLEVTLVNLAWTGSPLPPVLSLQVIWAIGLTMLALAALLWLPRAWLVPLALGIMLGHNLLDPIRLAPDETGHALWSILHQRDLVALPWGGMARTSYPVLPWIGVIAAGYALGPWFSAAVPAAERARRLLALGGLALAAFLALRGLDGYGDPLPRQAGDTLAAVLLAFVNTTKYPPSADYLLMTLGLGLWLLALFETLPARGGWLRVTGLLRVFGGAPLFFYLLHLWLLRALHAAAAGLGLAAGSGRVELGSVAGLWLAAALLALALYPACRWMVALKRRRRSPILALL